MMSHPVPDRAAAPPSPAARAPIEVPASPQGVRDDAAWAFCWQSLVEVSRTFSRPIEMLPVDLRAATTCGYLLCRIADTVEDDASLDDPTRDALFRALLDVLENDASADPFVQLAGQLSGRAAELHLAQNLERVMLIFRGLSTPMQQVCVAWTGEMIRGMSVFAHRKPGPNGVVTLRTLPDLERYCYFVAGTVGQMLTGLFLSEMHDLSEERAARMRAHAESFGLGLQMVNILKDQTDDLARNWCFIPETLWEARQLKPGQMLDPACHGKAHAAVEPIFSRTRKYLRDALEFTLAIPPEQPGIRLFCILPLWMAARTLRHAHRNDAMFIADSPVKISRDEVASLIAQAAEHVGDDTALRAQFSRLMST